MSLVKNEIEIDELNCPICQEPYNDDENNPRILQCGHTFCSLCLRSLLQEEDPLCPECRSDIDTLNVELLPVCYIVKKIADSVNTLNTKRIYSNTISDNKQDICDGEFPSVGVCNDHMAPKHFWCSGCKCWICGTCVLIDHKKITCNAVLARDAVEILIDSEKKKVYLQRDTLIKVTQFLVEFISITKNSVKISVMSRNQDILRKALLVSNQELKDCMESMEILEDALREIDELSQSKSLDCWRKIVNYLKILWCCQEYPKSTEDFLKDFWKYATTQGLFPSSIKNLKKLCIFTAKVGGKILSTTGQVEGDIFIIPSLKDRHNVALINFINFNFSDIAIVSSYTYMKLSERANYIGTIIFKTMSTPRSEHFRMLCTGEKGPCYRGSRFFTAGGNYNRFLAGGDYEYNNGTGGKSLFPFNDNLDVLMTEGLVCGNYTGSLSQLGQFKIFFECTGNYQSVARGIMAEVVQGLDLIKKIYCERTYPNVVISDCGIAYLPIQ